MTDGRQAVEEAVSMLDSEDRAWLEEQLRRYSELLAYLREH